ncbi:MAG TPA: uracil-DNA glycosylase family protein [Sphingomonadaceae bacterium]|nr:uracil-DNA glycosylase family protein [Sphingomonadaceae bacterium]
MTALSALDWWQLAGVDTVVADAPRDWLAPVEPRNATALPPSAASPAPAPPSTAARPTVPLPATLAAMHALLAAAPVFGEGGIRLAPEGDPASGLMVLIDMPEPEDAAAGHLLAGKTGLLFERMLAAIGRDRASVYFAAITPARPLGGALPPAVGAEHARLARHHVALAAPRAVLLMGSGASCAILGADLLETRGRLHTVTPGATPCAAIATFHPRFLFKQPARKAGAWCDLRLLAGALAQ